LKLVSILANVINFNPKFVTFITTSTILLNLFMELILSLTHRIYYYFYYLFISFHIESPLLIGVFLSFFFLFFSMILCLCRGLHHCYQCLWRHCNCWSSTPACWTRVASFAITNQKIAAVWRLNAYWKVTGCSFLSFKSCCLSISTMSIVSFCFMSSRYITY